ncbi:MAG TPA: M13-type metalloendopeptidase, partial [Candidatus Sulfotelmatobacter sp.]
MDQVVSNEPACAARSEVTRSHSRHESVHRGDRRGLRCPLISPWNLLVVCAIGGNPLTWSVSRRPPPDSPHSTTLTNLFPDLAVNGKQTLNENLADLGGISAAYDAYRASIAGARPLPSKR